MHLGRLQITNYKSFLETTVFNFAPGFNVLLGANSSGKSTVLEAISFAEFQNTPHRSILNCPEVDQQAMGTSMSELRFFSTSSEIQSLIGAGQDYILGLRFWSMGQHQNQQRTSSIDF